MLPRSPAPRQVGERRPGDRSPVVRRRGPRRLSAHGQAAERSRACRAQELAVFPALRREEVCLRSYRSVPAPHCCISGGRAHAVAPACVRSPQECLLGTPPSERSAAQGIQPARQGQAWGHSVPPQEPGTSTGRARQHPRPTPRPNSRAPASPRRSRSFSSELSASLGRG